MGGGGSKESKEGGGGGGPKKGGKTAAFASGDKEAPDGKTPGDEKITKKSGTAKCKKDRKWCEAYCKDITSRPEKAPSFIVDHKFSSKDEARIKENCKKQGGNGDKCAKQSRIISACYLELDGFVKKGDRAAIVGSDENSSNTGLIIGGAVAVIVLIAASIAAYLFCFSGGKGKGTRGTASKSAKSGRKSIKSSKSKRSSKSKASKRSRNLKSKKSGKSKKSKK